MISQTALIKEMVNNPKFKGGKASNFHIVRHGLEDRVEYSVFSYKWYELARYSATERLIILRSRFPLTYSPSTQRQISNIRNTMYSLDVPIYEVTLDVREGTLLPNLKDRVMWDLVREFIELRKENRNG